MSVTVPVTSIRKNLDQWDVSGSTWMRSNCPGAYFALKAGPTTSFTCLHDASVLSSIATAEYYIIHYSIDGGTPFPVQMTSSGADSIITGLSNGTHTLEAWVHQHPQFDASATVIDIWDTPVIPTITGIRVDNGASAISWPTENTANVMWIGDSTSGGFISDGLADVVANNNAAGLLPTISSLLDLDFCVLSFGGQGYKTAVAVTHVPALTTSYGLYSAGRSRLTGGLYQTAYKYIVILMGVNDSGLTATHVETAIANQRTAGGTQPIILTTVPFDGTNRTPITAGVAQYKANHPTDRRVYLKDMGAAAEVGLTLPRTPSANSWDGTHPKKARCVELAALFRNTLPGLIGETQRNLRARGYANLYH